MTALKPDEAVIEMHRLTKQYGAIVAVNDLTLGVGSGGITGFLGRNGAGKSTTIKMLLGIVRPSSGTARLLGRRIDDPRQNRDARRHVAYVHEDKQTYAYLTVSEMIAFTRSFYDDWRSDVEQRLLREYELPPRRKIRALSKGMRTKLALLLALARQPRLLILDEPSEGLDPVSIEQLLQGLVAAAAEGTTVFFSSHQISEVERIADRVCVLDAGRLVVDAPLDHIRQTYRRVALGFSTEPPAARHFNLEGVQSVRADGRQVTIMAARNVEAIVERGYGLGAVAVDTFPVSLREVFLETVGDGR
jgi:ABC-2 type transport system ATP-binding protein